MKGANFRDLKGVRVKADNHVEWDPDVERVYLPSGKPLVGVFIPHIHALFSSLDIYFLFCVMTGSRLCYDFCGWSITKVSVLYAKFLIFYI